MSINSSKSQGSETACSFSQGEGNKGRTPMKRFYPLVLVVLLIIVLIQGMLLVLIFTGSISLPSRTVLLLASPTSTGIPWGRRTKAVGCMVRGALPDPACTPGDILPGITKERVCQPGYASSIRDVTSSVKNQVYAEY